MTAINLSCVQCKGDHCKLYLLNKNLKAYRVRPLSNLHHHTKEGPRTNYNPQPLLILQPGSLNKVKCSLGAASMDVKNSCFICSLVWEMLQLIPTNNGTMCSFITCFMFWLITHELWGVAKHDVHGVFLGWSQLHRYRPWSFWPRYFHHFFGEHIFSHYRLIFIQQIWYIPRFHNHRLSLICYLDFGGLVLKML